MTEPKIVGNKIIFENITDEEIDIADTDEITGDVINDNFEKYQGKTVIFRNCTKLKTIRADSLHLSGLEIENCPEIEYLSAYNNKIKEAYLDDLTNLKFVNLSFNDLQRIDLSECHELQKLFVNNNKLINLDLTDNNKLVSLYCSYNKKLGKLKVSHLKNLKDLHCENCSLISLDCQDLENLKYLYCLWNKAKFILGETNETKQFNLLKLNVRGCKSLEELDCAENALKELELNNHPNLKIVSCKNNELDYLKIINCPKLAKLSFSHQSNFYCYEPCCGELCYKKLFGLDNLETSLFFDDPSSFETILHCKKSKIFKLSESGEPIPITFKDFPNLKEFGPGTANDPLFEQWIDEKRRKELQQPRSISSTK